MIEDFIEENKIGKIKFNEELKNYNTYKMGGIAKYIIYPDNVDKLKLLIKYLKDNKINYKIIGNGSNLIFSSKEFDGAIILLNRLNDIKLDNNIIYVEAGYSLIQLSNFAYLNSLSGLEFANAIPAKVGGAIYMNAGAYNKDMASVIKKVSFLDENLNIKELSKEELNFSYRHSIFQDKKYVIISAILELHKDNKNKIFELMNDRKKRRINSQPLNYPSAGSVFRNPSKEIFSGKLIEDLNLKGYRIGGAMVSNKHANFIINYDNATGEDVYNLINYVKNQVKNKYNIDLKVEQEFVNFGDLYGKKKEEKE